MVTRTLSKIEHLIQEASRLSAADRTQLLELIHHLRSELQALNAQHTDKAEHIAAATESAVRSGEFADIEQAIQEFEVSHPKLTQTLQSIINSLSNLGI